MEAPRPKDISEVRKMLRVIHLLQEHFDASWIDSDLGMRRAMTEHAHWSLTGVTT